MIDMDPNIYTQPIIKNPFEKPGARANSVYIGDTAFGDSGKGIVTAEFNRLLVNKFGVVYSLRVNGGGNAGHDLEIDGIPFLANQLPVAVAQEHGIGIITRGMVFNPRDGVMEIDRTIQTFGGKMPGELWIDDRTPLCLDTHRLLDTMAGSTGRGIGPAYADFYSRRDLSVRDLYKQNWAEVFGNHFDEKMAIVAHRALYARVSRLDGKSHLIGSKANFLGRLEEDKERLKPYVKSGMDRTLMKIWSDAQLPVTVEEAQGPGLDPFFGIRPDVTSSRPGSRFVQDATYGVIFGEDIALKVGVTKTVYMSSVGSRWLPGEMPPVEASFYHKEFGEFGKTTGRKRGIYYLPLPILGALKRFANYDYLVATHIDAAREDMPIKMVIRFRDKDGHTSDHRFYQDELDFSQAQYIQFPGWDGEATKGVKTPQDLDFNARRVLNYLSKTLAPVIMVRTGKNIGDNIIWWSSD